jgi:hypothetical protein
VETGAYRHDDPETSVTAALGLDASRLEKLAYKSVYDSKLVGRTMHETADETGVPYWSISPRFKPLRKKGLIFDSGERRKGRTRNEIVWKATSLISAEALAFLNAWKGK